MIVKFENKEDKLKLIELCKANGIKIEGVFNDEYDAYLSTVLDSCENPYRGIIGGKTIEMCRLEAMDKLDDEELDVINNVYTEILDKACDLMDSKPLGIYTISNTIGVELKVLNECEDTAIVKYGNELIECSVKPNNDGEMVIMVGEMELPMSDFIRC